MVELRRGDVCLAELSPTRGSEQAGSRPAIIVSRDAINRFSPVVIVVPITGLEHKTRIYPSQVVVRAGTGGLTKDSIALCEQVRAISKERLARHLGHLPGSLMAAVDDAMKIALDLS